MIKVLFFAQVRELAGCDALQVEGDFASVEVLRAHLAERGECWALALMPDRLLAVVNQTLVSFDHDVSAVDEVASFPPVTGG